MAIRPYVYVINLQKITPPFAKGGVIFCCPGRDLKLAKTPRRCCTAIAGLALL